MTLDGKEQTATLGKFSGVRAARANTFAAVKAAWIAAEARRQKWTSGYREEVEASLRNHASELDALPMNALVAPVVIAALRSVEHRSPDMATKVAQRLRGIFDYAVEPNHNAARLRRLRHSCTQV